MREEEIHAVQRHAVSDAHIADVATIGDITPILAEEAERQWQDDPPSRRKPLFPTFTPTQRVHL